MIVINNNKGAKTKVAILNESALELSEFDECDG
jgi:hypothetical protein